MARQTDADQAVVMRDWWHDTIAWSDPSNPINMLHFLAMQPSRVPNWAATSRAFQRWLSRGSHWQTETLARLCEDPNFEPYIAHALAAKDAGSSTVRILLLPREAQRQVRHWHNYLCFVSAYLAARTGEQVWAFWSDDYVRDPANRRFPLRHRDVWTGPAGVLTTPLGPGGLPMARNRLAAGTRAESRARHWAEHVWDWVQTNGFQIEAADLPKSPT